MESAGASEVLDELLASDLVDDPSRSPAAEPHRAVPTARRRRRWARQASLAAVALGAIGGFLAVSRVASKSKGSAFDRAVVRRVGRARSPVWTAVAKTITSIGSVFGAVTITGTAMYAARKRPRLVAQLAVGALGGVSAELWIKRIFRRQRPQLLPHLERVTSTSFPSGHSMSASSLYLTLAFVLARGRKLRARRGLALATAAAFASSVGATRVYLGVHWPTDVLGGLALGTAWACATEAGFDLVAAEQLEAAVEEQTTQKPSTGPLPRAT